MEKEIALDRPRPAALLLAAAILASALAALLPAPAAGQAAGEIGPGALFPEPFVVEHQVVHLEDDGTRFVSDPVTDTYGGSWLVSERFDGSRLVLDLARREITEIRPQQGTYWRLGFSRLAELQARYESLDEMPTADGLPAVDVEESGAEESGAEKSAERRTEPPRLELRELSLPPSKSAAPRSLESRAGVRHFRVERAGTEKSAIDTRPAAEVSVDPSIRLGERARAALSGFEKDALGADRRLTGQPSPLDVMKTVRQAADGAFPVRLRRPIPGGFVEDIVTRLERIERFDLELVRVPDGLERVAHPLESAVRFMEKESERRQLMGSLPQGSRNER